MSSVYAVYGSALRLILPDDFAEAVNNTHNIIVTDTRYDAIFKSYSPEWNQFANLMNHLIKINGGTLLDSLHDTKDVPILTKVET